MIYMIYWLDKKIFAWGLGKGIGREIKPKANKWARDYITKLLCTNSSPDLDSNAQRFFALHSGKW